MSHLFNPRDWQERFVRQYQANPNKNTLLEGCTSAGKTGGALYTFVSLRTTLDWKFVVVVTPSEHLRKQYAQDAHNLFDLTLYYSGTDSRLKGLPSPEDLLKGNYHGLVVSYQWLTKGQNAQHLADALRKSVKGKVFVILDEVHHASHELSFGRACETAFPDNVVAHRLMTSGTPFRSDNNRILGNWLTYEQIDENTYECRPDFRYTLADALRDQIIPPFSFVTLEGEFKYIRNQAVYEGQTFTNATTDQQLRDALNTAIFVDGDWVKKAILWAHSRMKRDRAKGLHECATYVRVSSISAARTMKERIRNITGEDALVVVSKEEDDPNSNTNFKSKDDSSQLIEDFAVETGARARSWIIGVNMLGEGVSINRLKYRIHATNICAPLSFIQDLGRLLRLFPLDSAEPVETLIPAHPTLIELATDVLNEVAHLVKESEEVDDNNDQHKGDDTNPIPNDEDKEPPYSRELNRYIRELLGVKDRSKPIRMDNPKKAAEKLLQFYQGDRLKELINHLSSRLELPTESPEQTLEKSSHNKQSTNNNQLANVTASPTNAIERSETTVDNSTLPPNPDLPALKPAEDIDEKTTLNNLELTLEELAKRLKRKPASIQVERSKNPTRFTNWTKQRDPEGIGWQSKKRGRSVIYIPAPEPKQE